MNYPSVIKSGDYVELEGYIVWMESNKISLRDGEYWVDVLTDKGKFRAFGQGPSNHSLPEVGYKARIRVYRQRGGYYPDHEVRGWSQDIIGTVMYS